MSNGKRRGRQYLGAYRPLLVHGQKRRQVNALTFLERIQAAAAKQRERK